ncbi:hypothetical protein M501DRAFT_1004515 [Patellaria atrata CBS 101060]|uniref:RNA helicase n=1 Tax=Patellaria atrata CBS 101060 TaxID=1346257 RepID=A0A9P4SA07_9PEZI|nr:hypothetical protein M501DRAFT_1004515 [Patellaria atrata CBS 101060]
MQTIGKSSGECLFCALVRSCRPRPLATRVSSKRARISDYRNIISPVRIRKHFFEGKTRDGASNAFESTRNTGSPNFKIKSFNHDEFRYTSRMKPEDFKNLIIEQLSKLRNELYDPKVLEGIELSKSSFEKKYAQYCRHVVDGVSISRSELAFSLRGVYGRKNVFGLYEQLKYNFYDFLTGTSFTKTDIQNQKALADLRYPSEWYPTTRRLQRTLHLHVGPTNSGKTYHALRRLEAADSGIYAGPLRLLAHEVFTRLNASGKRCGLVTGEERRYPDGDADNLLKMFSCTVEMAPANLHCEVAVIDEIQMINSEDRGWAWTQALMGLLAKEIHLCGEERIVPLIEEIAASMGEKLEVHRYKRLSPLQMESRSLGGNLNKLRKGDCIVSFTVVGIHALKREIEKKTGKRVAVVYGTLPPLTRAQQAALFNDQDNDYDFLVASDAIGMGLNLSIRRIIFETVWKFNGVEKTALPIHEIKQIAGRAGRYRTAQQSIQEKSQKTGDGETTIAEDAQTSEPAPNVGLVTTLEQIDFPLVEHALRSEGDPIMTAGLFPPQHVVERFASYFRPGTPFSYIMLRLHEISQVHQRFHLCRLRDVIAIADAIQPVRKLTIADRYLVTAAPVRVKDQYGRQLINALAKCIGEQGDGDLLSIKEIELEILDQEITGTKAQLAALSRLHQALSLYLWLSYRFSGVFVSRELAFHAKDLCEKAIETCLSQFTFTTRQRLMIAEKRKRRMLEDLAQPTEAKDMDRGDIAAGEEFEETPISDGEEEGEEFEGTPISDGEEEGEEFDLELEGVVGAQQRRQRQEGGVEDLDFDLDADPNIPRLQHSPLQHLTEQYTQDNSREDAEARNFDAESNVSSADSRSERANSECKGPLWGTHVDQGELQKGDSSNPESSDAVLPPSVEEPRRESKYGIC